MSRAKDLLNQAQDSQDEFWEMVNLRPYETGVTKIIWASPKMSSHGPRIKLSTYSTKAQADNWVSITISDYPQIVGSIPKEITAKDIEVAKQWIIKNKSLLLQFWNDELSGTEFGNRQVKI